MAAALAGIFPLLALLGFLSMPSSARFFRHLGCVWGGKLPNDWSISTCGKDPAKENLTTDGECVCAE
jgi:hypothetical protein